MEEQATETHSLSGLYTSDMPTFNNGVHKSLHVLRRSQRRRRHPSCRQLNKMQQLTQLQKLKEEAEQQEEEEEEEGREEIERKIQALQRIVPGGESFGVDELFDETAAYIVALQCRVKTLRALTTFFGKFEREKTKFGG